ncbi:PPR repeat [Musa troglodytarum]|nr:PPR repeat [Musa troglodytarum]
MPMEPDAAILGALLAGCRVHGDTEVGDRVSKRMMRMRPEKSGYYVSLANMYAGAGRYSDAERVREFMKERSVSKQIGYSSVESES